MNELEPVVNENRLPPVLAPEIASLIKLYRQLLYQTPRPFIMRTVLAGEPAVPHGLANVPINFFFAKLSLIQLSQHDWGAKIRILLEVYQMT